MKQISEQMSFIMNLWTINTITSKRLDGNLGAVHGIGFTEFMVLFHLSNAHNKTMRRVDLAKHIGVTASGITRLVLPMEKIGLVLKEANPRDARVSLVKLSASGEAILGDASTSLEEIAKTLLSGIKKTHLGSSAKVFKAMNSRYFIE